MSQRSLPSLAAFAAAMALVPAAAQAADVETALVSRASGFDGAPSESFSSEPSVSQDGRFVAFSSQGNVLSAEDDNAYLNVFVRDRATGATELVSRAPGVPANGDSIDPRITPDARYVVFSSEATNLAASDANGDDYDVFVYDRATGTTTHVSRADGPAGAGAQSTARDASISADGAKVAFTSSATNLSDLDEDGARDIFVRDIVAGTTELVSVDGGAAGDGDSDTPAISGDGTDVAFVSNASNLDGGGAPGLLDVFVRNLVNDTTTLVSRPTGFTPEVGNGDALHPAISHSGRYVAFQTAATNLVDTDDDGAAFRVLRRDTLTGQTLLVSRGPGVNGTANAEEAVRPSISADGGTVAFETASPFHVVAQPGVQNVYTRDVGAGTTTFISRATGPAGEGVNVNTFANAISGDGQTVAFSTSATNVAPDDVDAIADVFVRGLPIAPIEPPQDNGGGDNGGGGGGGGGGGEQQPPAEQPPVEQPPVVEPGPETQPVVPPVTTPATAPKLRMKLVRLRGKVAKVRIACVAGTCQGVLKVKRPNGKGKALGKARFAVAAGAKQTVTVRLEHRVERPKVRAIAKVRAEGVPARTITRKLRAPRR